MVVYHPFPSWLVQETHRDGMPSIPLDLSIRKAQTAYIAVSFRWQFPCIQSSLSSALSSCAFSPSIMLSIASATAFTWTLLGRPSAA